MNEKIDTGQQQVINRLLSRRGCRVVIGCTVALGLCLGLALTVAVGYQVGWQQEKRVEAAVRITMGAYCAGPDDSMVVYPAKTLLPVGFPIHFPANEWQVFCMSEKTDTPIITVNVARCEAKVVTPFTEAYTETLAICP